MPKMPKTQKKIIIVESPSKAKTMNKYLGEEFLPLASYGHVRDLPSKNGSVVPDNDFEMHYQNIEKNEKHIAEICKAAKQSKEIYLAPDPDREGEAIAWHIHQILEEKGLLKNKNVYRVVFHEITKTALQDAVAHPREISMNLVNAQQARRALDYLVGFNLSPLLWKKIQRGLSAGRVQSPALRLIVEREKEIEDFKAQEYWTIKALLNEQGQTFEAKLSEYQQKKLEALSIKNQAQADEMLKTLRASADGKLTVSKLEKKIRRRNPYAPFITSTLQQDASRRLGFSTRKTMMIAQQLYEGVDVGSGPVGLITYMRTDSVSLANEAIAEMRHYIGKEFGQDYLPPSPRKFESKVKNAQEAHEAIRPTSVGRAPNDVRSMLTDDQAKLYELIWKRAVACQMIHATLDTVSVDLSCSEGVFHASGSTVIHPGFMRVYQVTEDDKSSSDEMKLPPLQEGQVVDLNDIVPEQHFTEPPPRYSEASLVKTLEEYGIGRPSTYASIIATLLDREYAILEKKRFYPTEIGKLVNRFLTEYFSKYVDYNFTAQLEDELDAISRGEKVWIPVLKEFWDPFKHQVDEIETSVKRSDVTSEATNEVCPECGKPLVLKWGRNGRFIACSGYPECRYTKNVGTDGKPEEPQKIDHQCPKCGGDLAVKQSRFGKFIGCSHYPECKYTEPLKKPVDTGVICPQCKQGTLMVRQSRKNKPFYSCSKYPECKYVVFQQPVQETCPTCGWGIQVIKKRKGRDDEKVCPQKGCGDAEDQEKKTA